jgi:hypothetical protein
MDASTAETKVHIMIRTVHPLYNPLVMKVTVFRHISQQTTTKSQVPAEVLLPFHRSKGGTNTHTNDVQHNKLIKIF